MNDALIRRCDGCHMVTAVDMDNTLENKREMQVMGQTVTEVTEEQAHEAWKNARPCQCAKVTP